jgi:hypothetical protein
MGGQGWCLRCGYCAEEKPREEAIEAPPRSSLVPFSIILLVIGCGLIVAATVYRGRFLQQTSAVLVWWIVIEGGFGFVAYLVGHVWAIVATIRHWKDTEIFKYLDPLTVWKYAAAHLPRTGKAVCLAGWGATAFVCAFVVLWQNDFAFKDKERKPKPLVSVDPKRKGDGKDDLANLVEFVSGDEAESPEDARKVNVIDLTGDPEKERKLNTTECVVIGYVADDQDPGRISQLVLGTRGEDGAIRYAGTVSNFAKKDEVGNWLKQVKGLTPLLDTPAYLPGDLKAVAVEPTLKCQVGFTERTGQGLMKDTVLKGVSGPPAGEADKDKPNR